MKLNRHYIATFFIDKNVYKGLEIASVRIHIYIYSFCIFDGIQIYFELLFTLLE